MIVSLVATRSFTLVACVALTSLSFLTYDDQFSNRKQMERIQDTFGGGGVVSSAP